MKKAIIVSTILISILQNGFSQNLNYEFKARFAHPISRVKLNEAQTISDINSGFAKNWVTEYISTEISTTSNGKIVKASGKNDTLSLEQKRIISLADLGADITIDVQYKMANSVTFRLENNTMHFAVTLLAESDTLLPIADEAYSYRAQKMRKYMDENIARNITPKTPKNIKSGAITFTIDEEGEITNTKILKSSGDNKIDLLWQDLIQKMPKWEAAQNSSGTKIKLEFVCSFGIEGC